MTILTKEMLLMVRLSRALAALLAALSLFAPAALADAASTDACYYTEFDAEGNPTGPKFCREAVWFHQADTKVGNLAALGRGSFPSWNTTKPSQSVTAGAGGGYVGNSIPTIVSGTDSDPVGGATFEGKFTGNLDNLSVELFLFAPGDQNAAEYNMATELVVDGTPLLVTGKEKAKLSPGGNAMLRLEYGIVGIHEAMELEELNVGEDVEHTIRLNVTPWYFTNDTALFVYDTTEAPSGMIFNTEGGPKNIPVLNLGSEDVE